MARVHTASQGWRPSVPSERTETDVAVAAAERFGQNPQLSPGRSNTLPLLDDLLGCLPGAGGVGALDGAAAALPGVRLGPAAGFGTSGGARRGELPDGIGSVAAVLATGSGNWAAADPLAAGKATAADSELAGAPRTARSNARPPRKSPVAMASKKHPPSTRGKTGTLLDGRSFSSERVDEADRKSVV
jgi:hypothetical protein